MQRNRLKLWIIFSSVCAAIFCLFLFLGLGFRLKTVDVEFQSRLPQEQTKLESGIQEKIKDYFPYNKNIIVLNFNKTIQSIEKDYPYLKINQVIKNFPNVARVYISERVPKYRVQAYSDESMWLVLDEDFKVLEKLTNEQLHQENMYNNMSFFDKTIEISKDILVSNNNIGEKISGYEKLSTDVNQIMSGIYGKTEDYSLVFKIEIASSKDTSNYRIIMKNNAREDYNGCAIVIDGETDLKIKAFVGATTFQEEVKDDSINIPSTVIIIEYKNGKFIGTKIENSSL